MKPTGKRAPGGGRKPRGPFAQNAAQLTIRMPTDMRAQLEAAAQKRGWSLSQELLWRVRASFVEQREEQRDPAMRALCFLIAELAGHIVGPKVIRGKSEISLYNWRSDPFFYRAFKIAVGQLLDALEPREPIKTYKITANQAELDPSMKRYLASFKSPEARAEYSADYILNALRSMPEWTAERREEQRALLGQGPPSSLIRELYGILHAARDLAIKPCSGETTHFALDVMPFSWERPEEPKS